MPELPEVEIAARNIRAWAEGRRIVRVETDPRAARIFRPGNRASLARALSGARLVRVDRRGKHLLVTLEDRRGRKVGLWSHLGMTGKWLLREGADPSPSHGRVRLDLDDGRVLHYLDPRLFGRQRVVASADFAALPEVAALGPDPIHDGIDPGRLAGRLGATERSTEAPARRQVSPNGDSPTPSGGVAGGCKARQIAACSLSARCLHNRLAAHCASAPRAK